MGNFNLLESDWYWENDSQISQFLMETFYAFLILSSGRTTIGAGCFDWL